MLTAKDGDLDEAEALDTGADDYLTKPFSFPVLVARVRSLLRRGRSRATPVPVDAGDLRDRPGRATRVAWRPTRSPLTRPRVRRARVPRPAGRAGRVASARSSTACGSTTSTATRTSSRSTSAASGRTIDEPFERHIDRDRARCRVPPRRGRRVMAMMPRTIRVRITVLAATLIGGAADRRVGPDGRRAAAGSSPTTSTRGSHNAPTRSPPCSPTRASATGSAGDEDLLVQVVRPRRRGRGRVGQPRRRGTDRPARARLHDAGATCRDAARSSAS